MVYTVGATGTDTDLCMTGALESRADSFYWLTRASRFRLSILA